MHLSSMDSHSRADPEEPKEVSTQLTNRREARGTKAAPCLPYASKYLAYLRNSAAPTAYMVGLKGVDSSCAKGHNRLVPQCGMTEDQDVHERNSISQLAFIAPPVTVGNLRKVPL